MKMQIITFLLLTVHLLPAQTYEIGHISKTFHDPARSRDIPVHIYYPALTAGADVPVAAGAHPVLVYGHGFVMTWSAYENFWEAVVPHGYIMVFPTTESGLSPSHGNFGRDLQFLNLAMKAEGTMPSSPFYQKVGYTSALMGHSMGGGASVLAAANNADITALINFAAAETTPSAIDTCSFIDVQTLIFYGVNDGVTPPADHQLPMYNAISSTCKTAIGITGGGHCYFANSNLACSTGEFFTSPQPTISRAEQHEVIFDFLLPYLDYVLKNDSAAGQVFLDSLTHSQRIEYHRDCVPSGSIIMIGQKDKVHIFPNPLAKDAPINIRLFNIEKAVVTFYPITGQKLYQTEIYKGNNSIKVPFGAAGIYNMSVQSPTYYEVKKILVY